MKTGHTLKTDIMKTKFNNSAGQQFHQYQSNEQLPLTSNIVMYNIKLD
jgi:hypothetical protein